MAENSSESSDVGAAKFTLVLQRPNYVWTFSKSDVIFMEKSE